MPLSIDFANNDLVHFYGADMSSTAFIEPLPVVDFVVQVLGRDISSRSLSDADRVKVRIHFVVFFEASGLCQCLTSVFLNQVKKALRGVKVEVTHRGSVRRKYRISGLTSQPTRELMYEVFFYDSKLCS